jgi:hypothetical protein
MPKLDGEDMAAEGDRRPRSAAPRYRSGSAATRPTRNGTSRSWRAPLAWSHIRALNLRVGKGRGQDGAGSLDGETTRRSALPLWQSPLALARLFHL